MFTLFVDVMIFTNEGRILIKVLRQNKHTVHDSY